MKDYYVGIPNKMFAYGTEFYVDEYELYIYYTIAKNVLAWDTKCVHTSIDLLYQLIMPNDTNDTRAKKRIKDSIIKLKNKGYLEIECSSSFKNNTLITVKLFDNDTELFTEKISSDYGSYIGYTQVKQELINRANDLYQVKILIYIQWRNGIKYRISYDEWAAVLGVTNPTAINLINKAKDQNLITKNRGEYYLNEEGQPRQQMNSYSVKEPKNKLINPIKEEKIKMQDDIAKLNCTETRVHNWYDNNMNLTENDVYIYKTTNSSKLKKKAEKRMSAISQSSPKGKEMISEFLRKANKRIDNEKQMEELSNKKYMEELVDYREVPYKKQKTNDDYSYLLGND